jgi:hypothetical protein
MPPPLAPRYRIHTRASPGTHLQLSCTSVDMLDANLSSAGAKEDEEEADVAVVLLPPGILRAVTRLEPASACITASSPTEPAAQRRGRTLHWNRDITGDTAVCKAHCSVVL